MGSWSASHYCKRFQQRHGGRHWHGGLARWQDAFDGARRACNRSVPPPSPTCARVEPPKVLGVAGHAARLAHLVAALVLHVVREREATTGWLLCMCKQQVQRRRALHPMASDAKRKLCHTQVMPCSHLLPRCRCHPRRGRQLLLRWQQRAEAAVGNQEA